MLFLREREQFSHPALWTPYGSEPARELSTLLYAPLKS